MWFNLLVVIILVVLSGTFAGLTLALFSINLTTLERKIRLGDHQAETIYRIRKKGNLLLCTLLLGNVASYTIMAIFLGTITSGVIAGFVATALIFVFGEILPQAVFPRYAFWVGEKFAWLVWGLIFLFYPIAAPIAWILDRALGDEPPVLWNKRELGEIISYHEDVGDGIIDEDEERIILGALAFSDQRVREVMIPLEDVFFLEPETSLNRDVLEEIKIKGFSRIPVYDSRLKRIEGILYTKNLIGISTENGATAENMCSKERVIEVRDTLKLDNLMNLLVNKKMHMALVLDKHNQFVGVATLEDIMEEILKTELEDQKV